MTSNLSQMEAIRSDLSGSEMGLFTFDAEIVGLECRLTALMFPLGRQSL